jgi:hypothetical protein
MPLGQLLVGHQEEVGIQLGTQATSYTQISTNRWPLWSRVWQREMGVGVSTVLRVHESMKRLRK